MGTDSLFKGCFVVVVYSDYEPYGRMVECYPTEKEALAHIKFQKERMGSTKHWDILHIKDMEWLNPKSIKDV